MTVTLRDLLAEPHLDLTLVGGEDIDTEVSWVHSSDLLDPTPWLEAGHLLLTDGAQFAAHPSLAVATEYCERLHRRGLVGLGFAVDVLHPEIPAEIDRACAAVGLPLVRVPAHTPFITIVRHVADIVAERRSASLARSLDAQRAVARAAMRPGGLAETLRTLSDELGTWVALYDSMGTRVQVSGVSSIPESWSDPIGHLVHRLLTRGSPAALRSDPPYAATLQTIGQSRHLRGVLAVGTSAQGDTAQRDLLEAVIALASIALEQQHAVDGARGLLRAGVLELLESGREDAARRTMAAISTPLPTPPFRVIGVAGDLVSRSALDELHVLCARDDPATFFAQRRGDLVIVRSADTIGELRSFVEHHGLRAGVSTPVHGAELTRGIEEALCAAAGAEPAELVRFEDHATGGLRATLRRGGGDLVAERVLAPVFALPGDEGRLLVDAASRWFAHNTAWDPAARALGIHRHTLRARIERIARLTGLDLDDFAGRAELWAAIEMSQMRVAGA